jgi:heme A synthase
MKKTIWFTTKVLMFSAVLGFANFVQPVLAEDIFKTTGLAKETDPQATVYLLIKYLLGGAFTFATLALVAGAFTYINSAGSEDKAERGKSMMTNAIIGIVIIILAYVIASTVNTIFIGSCNNGVPTDPNTFGPCQ